MTGKPTEKNSDLKCGTFLKVILFLLCGSVPFKPLFAEESKVASEAFCKCPEAVTPKNRCAPRPTHLELDPFQISTFSCVWDRTDLSIQGIKDLFVAPWEEKSMKDIANYASCYRQVTKSFKEEKDQYCHFKNKLAPYIHTAANSFRLPRAVQACLIFQESQFDPTAGSKTGAMGYGQLMPDAIETIHRIVSSDLPNLMKNRTQSLTRLTQNLQKKLSSKYAKMANKEKAKLNDDIAYDQGLQRRLKAMIQAKKGWDHFWRDTANAPKQFSAKDVGCAEIAIAASMVKQTFDLHLIAMEKEDAENSIPHFKGMNEFETTLLLTGAYNGGIGALARNCADKKSFEECKNALVENKETHKHIVSIQNCAEKDNWKPRNQHPSTVSKREDRWVSDEEALEVCSQRRCM